MKYLWFFQTKVVNNYSKLECIINGAVSLHTHK